MSFVEKHYRQNGDDYFVTEMTNEQLLNAISVSSSSDIQCAGRRIAELADEIERLTAESKTALAALKTIQKLSGDWYQGAGDKKPGTVMMEIWAACNDVLDSGSQR